MHNLTNNYQPNIGIIITQIKKEFIASTPKAFHVTLSSYSPTFHPGVISILIYVITI